MAEDSKGSLAKAIVVIVGIIATILIAWYAYKKYMGTDSGDDGGIDPGPGTDPPPGVTKFWHFNESTEPYSKNLLWTMPQPCHLSSISGSFEVVPQDPGDWLHKRIGVSFYLIRETGEKIKIGKQEPPGGLGLGWHAFTFTPGLDNIRVFEIVITRTYGAVGLPDRLHAMEGDAIAVV